MQARCHCHCHQQRFQSTGILDMLDGAAGACLRLKCRDPLFKQTTNKQPFCLATESRNRYISWVGGANTCPSNHEVVFEPFALDGWPFCNSFYWCFRGEGVPRRGRLRLCLGQPLHSRLMAPGPRDAHLWPRWGWASPLGCIRLSLLSASFDAGKCLCHLAHVQPQRTSHVGRTCP